MLQNIYRKVRAEDYDPGLKQLIIGYRKQVNNDRWSSGVSAIAWALVWVVWYFWLIKYHPRSVNWQGLSGIAVLVLMFFVTKNQEQERKIIINAIALVRARGQ